MKHISFFVFALFLSFSGYRVHAQVVYADPGLPSDEQEVTVYFNASQGSGGLENYSGDIYAHTGVITNLSAGSSDWKYVKAGWDENIAACKMTRVSTNLYSLTIQPDIRAYYGVPSTETILKMAFVFRSSDGSKEGKGDGNSDIFVSVSTGAYALVISSPDKKVSAIDKDGQVNFKADVSQSSVITLTINGNTVFGVNGLNLSYPYVFHESGLNTIVVQAVSESETLKDSVYILVRDKPVEKPLPEGMEDGINYISDTEVTLVLHAPGKKDVFVLGDFNNWIPGNEYQLYKDGEKWWITISGLTPNQPYAYQYLIDGDLKVADPYAELVLDPWNDSYITDEVFPDMPDYPTGLTDGIAGVLEIKPDEFPWREVAFKAPSKEELVIYELHVRDFVEGHTYNEVQEKLDYLESLGINAIELMPFNEFEGNSSWGYNPSFYFAPDKYYGTPDDLKSFIDECHVRGIAVIMDMVLNHSFSQSPLVQMYLGQDGKVTEDNPWYNVDSPNQVYSWGYDFNHESVATKYFVDRVLKYWLQEFNLDGFRLDFTKGFTNTPGDGWAYDASRISILNRIYFVMQSAKPGSYMICEHLADNKEEKELSALGIMLWGNMNYNYNEATMGYFETSDLRGTSYQYRGWSTPNLISYMESHDEERLMYKNIQYGNSSGDYNIKNIETGIERNELAATFFFSIPGPKMIWQFGELGYDFSIDYNGRVGEKPIRWDYNEDPVRTALRDHYSKMIQLKTQNDVFNTNDFTLVVDGRADKQITLRSDDMDVSVVGNFGMVEQNVDPRFTRNGWWYEFFSGDSVNVTSQTGALMLDAGEYRIYSSSPLLKNVETSVHTPKQNNDVLFYPNPASDNLYFKSRNKIKSICIYTLSGQLMLQKQFDTGHQSLEISNLKNGLYLVKTISEDGVWTGQFMKR